MDGMTVSLATSEHVSLLLGMMEDFNRIEQIEWTRQRCEPALRHLLESVDLGVVGLLVEDETEAVLGYFVLTWGYDLEFNGRDAFLTELYLMPEARGRGLSRPFLGRIEAIAREHGVHALNLMVRPEHPAPYRLYTGAGYRSPPRVFLSKDL